MEAVRYTAQKLRTSSERCPYPTHPRGSTQVIHWRYYFTIKRRVFMKLTMTMGTFEVLDQQELFAVDGGRIDKAALMTLAAL